jgi:hypothetical protein
MSMSRSDRADLGRLLKETVKLAKDDVEQVAIERLADFEHQAASFYHAEDNTVWAQQKKMAKQVEAEANNLIAEQCRELGIPDWAAPSLGIHWYSRGQNACKERVTELRRVAKTRFDTDAKRVKVEIDRAALEISKALIVDGLETDTARLFLAAMPTAEKLMPTHTVAEIEAVTADNPLQRMRQLTGADDEDEDEEEDFDD